MVDPRGSSLLFFIRPQPYTCRPVWELNPLNGSGSRPRGRALVPASRPRPPIAQGGEGWRRPRLPGGGEGWRRPRLPVGGVGVGAALRVGHRPSLLAAVGAVGALALKPTQGGAAYLMMWPTRDSRKSRICGLHGRRPPSRHDSRRTAAGQPARHPSSCIQAPLTDSAHHAQAGASTRRTHMRRCSGCLHGLLRGRCAAPAAGARVPRHPSGTRRNRRLSARRRPRRSGRRPTSCSSGPLVGERRVRSPAARRRISIIFQNYTLGESRVRRPRVSASCG